jgi:non-ribosomal peptide synthetase component F
MGLHQLFEAQVDKTPDTMALVAANGQLTYRELDRRANQLAHYLQTLGVRPDVLVGLCMERSLEMVIGLLGILKAGGAYVPLDPAYPKERLAFMLADTHAPVLLTQARVRAELPDYTGQVVSLDTEWHVIAQERTTPPQSPVTAANLAYVIYTSGSTGTPKGVAIEHRNTVALLDWARRQFAPEALAGVLASTSLCFDLSVFELFVSLSWGGTVVLAENLLQLPQWSAGR